MICNTLKDSLRAVFSYEKIDYMDRLTYYKKYTNKWKKWGKYDANKRSMVYGAGN